jgi:K+-sensing histidine kinase KdpD
MWYYNQSQINRMKVQ